MNVQTQIIEGKYEIQFAITNGREVSPGSFVWRSIILHHAEVPQTIKALEAWIESQKDDANIAGLSAKRTAKRATKSNANALERGGGITTKGIKRK